MWPEVGVCGFVIAGVHARVGALARARPLVLTSCGHTLRLQCGSPAGAPGDGLAALPSPELNQGHVNIITVLPPVPSFPDAC